MNSQAKFHVLLGFIFLLSWANLLSARTPSPSGRSPLIAYVDRPLISPNESINFHLVLHISTNKEPNIKPLEKDFEILNALSGSETTIRNGQAQSKTTREYTLFYKGSKNKFMIPSIEWAGYKSSPIKIEVVNHAGQAPANISSLELQASTNKKEVYVSEELIISFKLRSNLEIRNGALENPKIKNAIVEPLDEIKNQSEVIDGKLYSVFERRYALYPTSPGELIIEPLLFEGRSYEANKGQRNIFGFSYRGKPVRARSNKISLNVKEVPKAFPQDHVFLPVENFTIIETLPESKDKYKIGEALTRQFKIKAQGTLPSFLPKIDVPVVDGLQVYLEEGRKIQKISEESIISSSSFSQVYMPNKGGTFLVPEQKIYWWDTKNDQLREQIIQSLKVNVIGGNQNKSSPIADAQPTQVDLEDESKPSSEMHKSEGVNIWMIVSAIFFLMWLVTLIFWQKNNAKNQLKRMQKTPLKKVPSPINLIDKLATLAKNNQWHECLPLLKELKNISHKAHQEHLDHLIFEIEKSFFQKDGSLNKDSFFVQIKTLRTSLKEEAEKKDQGSLPPLYKGGE